MIEIITTVERVFALTGHLEIKHGHRDLNLWKMKQNTHTMTEKITYKPKLNKVGPILSQISATKAHRLGQIIDHVNVRLVQARYVISI